jgi:pyruvate/2-oxoglutarate dehydrogenase complex dihydrolipoamide acyltransferase (E2) component
MKVEYIGPYDGVDIPLPLGGAVHAEHGVPVELRPEIAEGLLVQTDIWRDPDAPAPTSAPPAPAKDVKELAAELGVDLDKVEGTGKDGRIGKKDVKAAAEAIAQTAAAPTGGEATEENQPPEGATKEAE